jgi:hypothetical protein
LGAIHAEKPNSVVSLRTVGPMKTGSWLTLGPSGKEPMLGCVGEYFGAGTSIGTRSGGNGVVRMSRPCCATAVRATSRSNPITATVTVRFIIASE